MDIALVVTTINKCYFIYDYVTAALADPANQYKFIIIGDKKTPDEFNEKFLDSIAPANSNVTILYYGAHTQERVFGHLEIYPNIPWNSDERRQLGYYLAISLGCEWIISIDDDNYPVDTNYFTDHLVLDKTRYDYLGPYAKQDNCPKEWVNAFKVLNVNIDKANPVFPRGHPYSKRDYIEIFSSVNGNDYRFLDKIVVNQGLNFGHLDVDAATILSNTPGKYTLRKDDYGCRFSRLVVDPYYQIAINTQNTAFHRSVVPFLYFWNMNNIRKEKFAYPLARYGDIFMGQMINAFVRATGKYVSFGNPIALHQRNSHNYVNDLKSEMLCIAFGELLDILLDNYHAITPIGRVSDKQAINELMGYLNYPNIIGIGIFAPKFQHYAHTMATNLYAWQNDIKEFIQ